MSELREFVADLLERRGAAIEALGPDRLEVLAPALLQKQLGWPELTHLGFGTERARGTIAIALEGDSLDQFAALLADEGRWSEREVRPPAAVPPPSDPERVLDRVLNLPNAVWRFQGMSATWTRCLMLAFRFTAVSDDEARGTDLARLQPRHRRAGQRRPGAAAAGAGTNARLAHRRQRPHRPR